MHFCPDCGQACYCHGDIDDCVVETEAYSSAHCTHYRECEAGDDWDEDWDDGWEDDEPDFHFGPPMPDPDDQQLGPVADLFCSRCKRHTEHLECETEGAVTTYRCSQCYASQRAETQPVFYDPTLHRQTSPDQEGTDVLPF